jgi:hypothetical protein
VSEKVRNSKCNRSDNQSVEFHSLSLHRPLASFDAKDIFSFAQAYRTRVQLGSCLGSKYAVMARNEMVRTENVAVTYLRRAFLVSVRE